MIGPHSCFAALPEEYLFTQTAAAIREEERRPGRHVCRLGVGDAAYPLGKTVVRAMREAAEEMGRADGFRGYPPEGGYLFLREALARFYSDRGIDMSPEDIFVGDGAKSDGADLLALTDAAEVLLQTPGYPVYADAAALYGRRVVLLPGAPENGFCPPPPEKEHPGALIVLVSPGNPCGTAYSRAALTAWVAYARSCGACLLFDSSYFAFVRPGGVHSIYEIPGARTCAVEVGSFSKFAGFTGLRLSYLVMPEGVRLGERPLRERWARRQACRFNGVSYITQRAGEAALTPAGQREWRHVLRYYQGNAALLRRTLSAQGVPFFGGEDSPYLFAACPAGMSSWDCFHALLSQAGVAVTPGAGFGRGGEGYVRLSALARVETVREAALRLSVFFASR